MISWTKISEDNWLLRWDGKVKKFNDQVKLMLWTICLDVHIDEVERAMSEIIKNDHNYCEFGFWKTFIFSKELGGKDEKPVH